MVPLLTHLFFGWTISLIRFLNFWTILSSFFNGNFLGFFLFMYVILTYFTMLHLQPLRFYVVGGCLARTQDSCDFDIDSKTL
jgi:hypothetical protein